MLKLYKPVDSLLAELDAPDERLGYTAGAEWVAMGDIDTLECGDTGEFEGYDCVLVVGVKAGGDSPP